MLEERLGTHGAGVKAGADAQSLENVQRRHILDVLDACNWRINGAGNAAEQLACTQTRCGSGCRSSASSASQESTQKRGTSRADSICSLMYCGSSATGLHDP